MDIDTRLSPAPSASFPNLVPRLRFMKAEHASLVEYALDFYTRDYHGTERLQALPGADTWTRLANRLSCGMSVQQSAYRELDYRLSLALQSRVWPAPCLIGM